MSGDPLEGHAEQLVQTARLLSVTTFIPLLNEYPFLSKCKTDDWDFFSTAACIAVGIFTLVKQVPQARFKALYNSIFPEIDKWSSRGEKAVLDCYKFVGKSVGGHTGEGKNTKYLAEDALGMWMVWNLMQREPSSEERKAVRAIGITLAAPFSNWWNEKK